SKAAEPELDSTDAHTTVQSAAHQPTVRGETPRLADDHVTIRTQSVDAADSVVVIRDLSLWYGAFQALHDVSITIPRNQVTALIGASGCGKSTLLRTINR